MQKPSYAEVGPARSERGLSPRWQIIIVAGFAAAVLTAGALFVLLSSGPGFSETATDTASRARGDLTLTAEQLSAIATERVGSRTFFTVIDAEGYIAPNAGFVKHGEDGQARSIRNRPLIAGQTTDIVQAENDFASATAQYQLAAATETREHQLFDADGAALKDWRQSQAELASATAALAAARNKLALMGVSAGSDPELGQGEAVFAVTRASKVWLVANIREAEAGLIRPGVRIEARIPAYPAQLFAASVTYIAPALDPASHRLIIGAELDNSDGRLRTNMQAHCRILAGPEANAPAVPNEAVIYEGDKARVWVIGREHRATLRSVKLGRSNEGFVEILDGLAPGEEVATKGALFLDRSASTD